MQSCSGEKECLQPGKAWQYYKLSDTNYINVATVAFVWHNGNKICFKIRLAARLDIPNCYLHPIGQIERGVSIFFEGIFQPTHLLLILVVVLIIFGPGKLPEVGKAVGKTLNEFRRATAASLEPDEKKEKKDEKEETKDISKS